MGPQAQLLLLAAGMCGVYAAAGDRYARWASFELRRDVRGVTSVGQHVAVVLNGPRPDTVFLQMKDTTLALDEVKEPLDAEAVGRNVVVLDRGGTLYRAAPGSRRVEYGRLDVRDITAWACEPGPDNSITVAVGDSNGSLHVGEISPDLKWTLSWSDRVHRAAVRAIAITPDEVVTVGADGSMLLVPLTQTGTPVRLELRMDCEGLRFEGVKGQREFERLRWLAARPEETASGE